MRDLGIADRLRNEGLKVVEVAGWQTRGDDTFDPRGSVDHHTAGAALGNAPSLTICTYGRADLPGPLCHVLVARDNTCYVIASGRANHAGDGGWQGLTGNSSVYGVERENVGTGAEPWRPDQTLTAARVHAALIRSRTTVDKVCRHQEWAPTRKIDTYGIDGDELRTLIGRVLAGIEEDDMTPEQADKLNATHLLATATADKVDALADLLLPLLKEKDDVPYARLKHIIGTAARPDVKRLAARIAKALPDADAKVIADAVAREFADALAGD